MLSERVVSESPRILHAINHCAGIILSFLMGMIMTLGYVIVFFFILLNRRIYRLNSRQEWPLKLLQIMIEKLKITSGGE